MIVNNGENKLFLMANLFPATVVEPNIVKIKRHNFTGLMQEIVSYCHVCFSNLNMKMFSHVSGSSQISQN